MNRRAQTELYFMKLRQFSVEKTKKNHVQNVNTHLEKLDFLRTTTITTRNIHIPNNDSQLSILV